ncbi:PAC2 family protein [Tessaracoccus sp. MC1865]|uniref:PAC2 family protein n=1 Tax=Tessaracoccus sp. MC1865 TaxID=2760310 RepID=UPI001604279F|nr:PAC2 family protein [Tessaracoccus sp. MC1865]MBB1483209.1 PAC2 family protein [Tessaracoccus sp. MC1865]QTO37374.1 PAC2 family protein [Tessaracoccus sp. MC1865]
MLDPAALYQFESHVDPRTIHAKAMVVTLGAFVDAGHVQRLVDEHLLETLPNHVLARFDADQLLDYASRRPPITFERDHFTDYERPEITLHHVLDTDGAPFLLLNGPEPSYQWERMAAAVVHLADTFDVAQVITLQGVPMAVPHTRPVSLSRFATSPDLIPGHQPIFGTMRMGASLPALLNVRLGEADVASVGLAAHIPPYLAETDFPAAAVALLDSLGVHAQLNLPTSTLETKAVHVAARLGEGMAADDDLRELVESLEEQHDRVVRALGHQAEPEDVPSADELGAQAEAFLRSLDDTE